MRLDNVENDKKRGSRTFRQYSSNDGKKSYQA